MFVGYCKRHTGRVAIVWSDAVDAALCFGWIDGRVNSVDAERHMQRFTPRKPASTWSAVNIAKVEALRAGGRMRPAGEAAFARRREDKTAVYSYEQREDAVLAPEQEARFRADAAAWAWFQAHAAVVPAHGDPLGRQREAAGDARAAARGADLRLGRRAAGQAAAAADRARPGAACRCARRAARTRRRRPPLRSRRAPAAGRAA